ncbi:MAG: O-antigen ligase family protein, partial [Dehalococcoidales bacterium]|nr:O-antigen ligase family protein [Dehalococcoidales bacterium]
LSIPLTISYLLMKIEEEKESESHFLLSGWFWIITILIALQTIALLTTFSRGAWLGLSISLIVLILLSGRTIISYYRQLIPSLAVILIITFSMLGLISVSANNSRTNRSISKRALSTFEITEGTSGNRLYIWKMSLPMISSRPFFGYGLDTYGIVFEKFRPSDWYKKITEQAVPDKAHNGLLQVTVDQGIIGLIAYIALIAALLIILISSTRKCKNTFERTFLIGVITATIAYLIQLQFSFSVISVAPLFWILAGIGMSTSTTKNNQMDYKFKIDLPRSIPFKTIILIAALLLSLYFLMTIFLTLMADFYVMRGHNQLASNYYMESIDDFDKAISLNNTEVRYYLFLEEAYFTEYKLTRSRTDTEKILDILHKTEELNPYQIQIYFSRGNLYREMAGKSNKQLKTKAIKEYKKILEYDPNNADAHFNIAVGCFDIKNYNSAISYWRKTVNLDPKDEQAYIGLGESYKIQGQQKKAKEAFESALRINPYNTYIKKRLQEFN